MKIVKAFRFRVYPTREQVARLGRWNDALRFLWNLALEQRLMGLARLRDDRILVSAFEQMGQLTELRAELSWLADVPRDVCDRLLIQLDEAWQFCFGRLCGRPRWKKRGPMLSFSEPHPKKFHLNGSRLWFPKLGNLRVVAHRPLEGRPKTCTLKCEGDQWFASIVCNIEASDLPARSAPIVALDRGVVNVVGDSDGTLVPSPGFYENALARIARAQRAVDRKKKGSNNRGKAKLRVTRLHRKVRRQRDHFLHALSLGYAKSHGVVVIERLQIDNLMRRGGALARGIQDAAWCRIAWMLEYKLAWRGGRLEREVAAYSSQTCSACGHVDARLRSSQAAFHCTACGHTEHADLNAPKVLRQRYEARVNRSGKPVDGTAPEAAGRSRKRVVLRVPRRPSR
jgi:putative transposase